MKDRTQHPAYALHAVVSLLDKAADGILRDRLDLTFARFLTLLTVQRLGTTTQRALAAELGLSEPSVSRSVAALARDGWLSVASVPGTGNRRKVELTDAGTAVVDEAADTLEAAFATVLEAAGLSADGVLAVTTPLLTTLKGGAP